MVLEQQALCNCQRGEKVMYTCVKTECPNHKSQPLYCISCNADEPPRHDHRTKEISIDIDLLKGGWLSLRRTLATKIGPVKDWFDTYEPLL